MKKKKFLLPLFAIILSISCTSCDDNETSISNQDDPKVEDDILFNEYYDGLKKLDSIHAASDYEPMYEEDLFGHFPNIKYQELYKNNVLTPTLKDGQITENDDAKYLFYNDEYMRFVNRSDGYAFNLKTDSTFKADFKVAAYRNRLYNTETTLTVSKETKNPYSSWITYRDEWLLRYVMNEEYLHDNNLYYTPTSFDPIFESNKILENYIVTIIPIYINDPGNIRKMFYNIGVVRNEFNFKGNEFYLFVMKSTHDRSDDFVEMIQSFEVLDTTAGVAKNQLDNMELKENPNWSEETKNYFEKLCNQDRTDWGMYVTNIDKPTDLKQKLNKLSTAMDYDFDIIPTYQHISYHGRYSEFALGGANATAGGNGFNGLPVLQFSYQFTDNNNFVSAENTLDCYTPMFDILRGPDPGGDVLFDKRNIIDTAFKNLANGLKAYGKPVLFRLNNEMNTDWTSYCGMMTLLDPDIFQATWRYLYNFLQEQGVNNTIWIFNPMARSCPYSAWGEDLSYFPGNDYVQALGLTYYEDNNSNTVGLWTFREDYTELYIKNNPVWNKYPWIISEFGCGAGGTATGKLYRNQDSQTRYVTGMFQEFAERSDIVKNIKGAVWFSVNDYNSKNEVTNQYSLEPEHLPTTIEAFKNGLQMNKTNNDEGNN